MAGNHNMAHLPFGDDKNAPWYGKDILTVKQFGREDLEYVFGVAHEMHDMVDHIGTFDLLKGKILANLFYEPSTRTSSSFTAAMERLGGSVIPINEVKYSSVAKGESLPDTVRSLECYADVIVIRHPEVGSAALAAKYARKPVINAGDGIGEHPTQALLDSFTIREELGRLDGLTVTLLGDLKHGRTVHSLARLLSLYKVKLNYVSPDLLRMPPELIAELDQRHIEQFESPTLESVLPETDVLYVTRVQKERFTDEAVYEVGQERLRHHPAGHESRQRAHDRHAPAPPCRRDLHGSGRRPPRRLLPPDGVRSVRAHGPAGHGSWKSIKVSRIKCSGLTWHWNT